MEIMLVVLGLIVIYFLSYAMFSYGEKNDYNVVGKIMLVIGGFLGMVSGIALVILCVFGIAAVMCGPIDKEKIAKDDQRASRICNEAGYKSPVWKWIPTNQVELHCEDAKHELHRMNWTKSHY